jgi:fatty-acyl-CoA synthase
MQTTPLTLPHFFHRAERFFWDKDLVTARPWGRERTTYGAWALRTRRLAGALHELGVAPDARLGTLAWNTDRHLELYFAVPGTGRVLHTLNLRLYAEQLVYIVNHAGDEVIFVDRSLTPLLWPILRQLSSVRHVIVMDDEGRGDELPPSEAPVSVHDYEQLLAAAEPADLDARDEWAAASLCYTSGTTGNPKGVAYTHRSMYLHTLGVLAAGTLGVDEPDRILPVVPMFHANAWGLAHAAVAAGSSLVLPGADLSPPAVASLIVDERVTLAAGVPTIWRGVLPELEGRDTSQLRLILGGGSAIPRALSEAYRRQLGIPITQAWGMTETSPVASVCRIKSTLSAAATDDELAELRTAIGPPVVGVEARVTSLDGDPNGDDTSGSGELQVHGPWIASGYLADDRSGASFTPDGWLRTGDVATMDEHGYLRIVDRTKDVIKSGGEWVSSVDLENELMAHPSVAEAAVIGLPHSKWQERPLACVVLRPDAAITDDDLLEFLRLRVAKWWLPDEIVFLSEIPKTSVGKFSKRELRDRFAGHVLPTDRANAG